MLRISQPEEKYTTEKQETLPTNNHLVISDESPASTHLNQILLGRPDDEDMGNVYTITSINEIFSRKNPSPLKTLFDENNPNQDWLDRFGNIIINISTPEYFMWIAPKLRDIWDVHHTPLIVILHECYHRQQTAILPFADIMTFIPYSTQTARASVLALEALIIFNAKMAENLAQSEEGIHRNPIKMFDDLKLNLLTREFTIGGKRLDLSVLERNVLETLIRHKGPMKKEELLKAAWEYNTPDEIQTTVNLVEVSIFRLRKKMEDLKEPRYILTLRGRGYCFGPTWRALQQQKHLN